MRKDANVEVSVVVPVYNEENNLEELQKRLFPVLDKNSKNWELVFVNDGSRDNSLAILVKMSNQDERIVALDLARNFGHQAAISAGIAQAKGRCVIVMDADLQDSPESITLFLNKWREGFDVVYAIRKNRKENKLKVWCYAVFYKILRKLASVDMPLDAGDFSLMDRKVVDVLVALPERNRFVRGLRSWIGMKQTGVEVERDKRFAGESKYNLKKLLVLAFDGLVSFSFVPLRVITAIGGLISVISAITALGYMIHKLSGGYNPPGFPTLIVSILFLSGVQLITIGLIGEYVGRIYDEVKQRPVWIVRKIYRKE